MGCKDKQIREPVTGIMSQRRQNLGDGWMTNLRRLNTELETTNYKRHRFTMAYLEKELDVILKGSHTVASDDPRVKKIEADILTKKNQLETLRPILLEFMSVQALQQIDQDEEANGKDAAEKDSKNEDP